MTTKGIQYSPHPEIAAAIKDRLSVLLQSDRPTFLLGVLTKRKAVEMPGVPPSAIEDQVMQDLIKRYKDRKLDKLWHLYNVGYFAEDTQKFLKDNPGVDYEDLQLSVWNRFITFQYRNSGPKLQTA